MVPASSAAARPRIGRVPVVAAIHRCGCVTGHTFEGYLAEAAFCPEALRIERERLVLRGVQRETKLDDHIMDDLIPALEGREAALEAHRRAAGVAERIVRTSDPELLPGDVPKAAPSPRPEASTGEAS